MAAGALIGCLYKIEVLAPAWFGYPPPPPITAIINNVADPARFVSRMLFGVSFVGLGIALAYVFLLVLLRVLLRREWVAVVVWIALLFSPSVLFVSEARLVVGALALLEALIFYAVITRLDSQP